MSTGLPLGLYCLASWYNRHITGVMLMYLFCMENHQTSPPALRGEGWSSRHLLTKTNPCFFKCPLRSRATAALERKGHSYEQYSATNTYTLTCLIEVVMAFSNHEATARSKL